MLTATQPGLLSWGAAGRRGPRHHHADAAAEHRSEHTGRTAVAVADGVGDSAAAAFAATMVADHAVRVATLDADAALAVRACSDLLRSAGDLATGDAALVVALAPGGDEPWWSVAWVGDCRAYCWDGRALHALTRDHTVAEQMRAGGVTANARFEHVLTTSVRTARPAEVGAARLAGPVAPRSLVLLSDGVHRAVPAQRLAAILGACRDHASPTDRSEWIVEAATESGTTDNATALVIDAGGDDAVGIPAQRAA